MSWKIHQTIYLIFFSFFGVHDFSSLPCQWNETVGENNRDWNKRRRNKNLVVCPNWHQININSYKPFFNENELETFIHETTQYYWAKYAQKKHNASQFSSIIDLFTCLPTMYNQVASFISYIHTQRYKYSYTKDYLTYIKY